MRQIPDWNGDGRRKPSNSADRVGAPADAALVKKLSDIEKKLRDSEASKLRDRGELLGEWVKTSPLATRNGQ
jgi:hypothetical protein